MITSLLKILFFICLGITKSMSGSKEKHVCLGGYTRIWVDPYWKLQFMTQYAYI